METILGDTANEPEAQPSVPTVRSQVISGLRWTASVRLVAQLFTWGITLVVVRFVRPGDYGLLAMGSVFTYFFSLVSELGLGLAVVQAKDIEDRQLRQVFGSVLVINATIVAALFFGAPLIARLFGEQRLVWLTRVLALPFVFAAVSVLPESLVQRRLDFKTRSLIDLTAALAAGCVTLLLAVRGLGVWALAIGSVVSAAWRAGALNRVEPFFCAPQFSMRDIRRLYSFGGYVTVSRLLTFFYNQADIFLAGKLLGKELLGFYSVAMHVASLPVQRISPIVNQVVFPAFARIQDERERVGSHFLMAVRILSLLMFPLSWGISSVAPQVVNIFLGPQWKATTLPLQLLAVVMPIKMISNSLPSALEGVGRAEVETRNLITAAVLMWLGFVLGCRWGLLGLSLAWLTMFPIVFLVNLWRSMPVLGLGVGELVVSMAPSAAAGLGMVAVVVLTRSLVAANGGILQLLLLVSAGAVTYIVMAVLVNRRACTEIVTLLRKR